MLPVNTSIYSLSSLDHIDDRIGTPNYILSYSHKCIQNKTITCGVIVDQYSIKFTNDLVVVAAQITLDRINL